MVTNHKTGANKKYTRSILNGRLLSGLVFNIVKQICDWPESVAPPCGTNTTEFSEGENLEMTQQLNLVGQDEEYFKLNP